MRFVTSPFSSLPISAAPFYVRSPIPLVALVRPHRGRTAHPCGDQEGGEKDFIWILGPCNHSAILGPLGQSLEGKGVALDRKIPLAAGLCRHQSILHSCQIQNDSSPGRRVDGAEELMPEHRWRRPMAGPVDGANDPTGARERQDR